MLEGMIPPLARIRSSQASTYSRIQSLVAFIVSEHVSVEGERGRAQVHGRVADDVVVILEMLEHLLVAVLAVAGPEPVLDFDRVAGPVEGRRLAEQGPAAAVEQAADDLVLGVVVGCAGIVVQVEAGVPRDPLPEPGVVRVGQALEVEDRQPLAVVQPVEHDGKFLVVHPVARERHVLGPGRGVLAEVPFPGFLEHATGSSRERRARTAPASR